jgi:hypothetical protein
VYYDKLEIWVPAAKSVALGREKPLYSPWAHHYCHIRQIRMGNCPVILTLWGVLPQVSAKQYHIKLPAATLQRLCMIQRSAKPLF